MERQLWTQRPSSEQQGQGDGRVQVEALEQISRAERGCAGLNRALGGALLRFAARQAGGRGVERPVEWRASQFPVCTGRIKAGGMRNGDHLPGRSAQEVLVALYKSIEIETVSGFRKKGLRLHLGV